MNRALTKWLALIIFPLLAVLFYNCEKDDICDPTTPVTPRITIDFYDAIEQDNLRNVTNLAIFSVDMDQPDTIYSNVSKIRLPMNTNADSVVYKMVLNYQNQNPLLTYTDTLQFNYSRLTEYVSRACGYKTTFDLNNDISLPRPFILNGNPAFGPGNWIRIIEVEEYNISNETDTHVKIYF